MSRALSASPVLDGVGLVWRLARRCLCTADRPSTTLTSRAQAMRLSFLGGDHNEITLMGTVVSVKAKEYSKDSGVVPYMVMQVATLFRYKESASGTVRTVVSRHQVTTFSPFILQVVRQVNPGDRVFVSGRMEYFFSNKVRVANIQATRIVPMLPKQLQAQADAEAEAGFPDEDEESATAYE